MSTVVTPEEPPVERGDIIAGLRAAHDEIITLRRQVAELTPRAHAYDTIAALARSTAPAQPVQGYGIDAAWRCKQLVEQLVAERKAGAVSEGIE